jgi:hypothetical protein
MRVFGQEGLGRPDIEMETEVGNVQKYLAKELDESAVPEVKPMMVFTNDEVILDAGDATVPALKLKQIKDFFRQKAREKPLSQSHLAAVKAAFEE